MEDRTVSKWFLAAAALCLLLLIGLTRGYALTHNLMGHPDEHVFTFSTEVLLDALQGGDPYEPYKAYPEGTYVFRLPFQLLGRAFPLRDDYDQSLRVWGRIASVFYYSLGALLGLWLVAEPLRGGRAGALVYGCAVVFGLFQLEQSRYGTFDPISFFVLMLLLCLTARYFRRGGLRRLLGVAFCAGVAAAGKYPLCYFLLLPAAALWLRRRESGRFLPRLALLAACAALGFLLFSPSILQSPRFFLQTALGGITGYVRGGNPEGYSTVPESVFSTLVYQLFYADLPLGPVFAAVCVTGIKRRREESAEQVFFSRVLPAVMLVFLGYNLLLTTFYFRTLFPYFCVSLLYASAGLGALCRGRRMRLAAALLCAAMAARGLCLTALLGQRDDGLRAAQALAAAAADAEPRRVVSLGNVFTGTAFSGGLPEATETVSLTELWEGRFPELQAGDLVVTDSLEHGLAKKCFFPPNKAYAANITAGWECFKADNAAYLRAKLYPDWIYLLFGFWTHGSTATDYEFHSNWLYAIPA